MFLHVFHCPISIDCTEWCYQFVIKSLLSVKDSRNIGSYQVLYTDKICIQLNIISSYLRHFFFIYNNRVAYQILVLYPDPSSPSCDIYVIAFSLSIAATTEESTPPDNTSNTFLSASSGVTILTMSSGRLSLPLLLHLHCFI